MKSGLVLEGGGMRGMFTSGVLDVIMENDISFDGAVGVSAGASFGCNIKSKQIGRAIRYNKKYCGDSRYASYMNIITKGDLFGVDFCFHELPFVLDPWDYKTFAKNPMEFFVTCTDVETGKPFYYKCDEGLEKDIKYIQASSSMPLASQVVCVDDHKLLDGGVADSIPIKFMEDQGYDKIVVILTQPDGYVKKKNPLMLPAKLILHKYPNLITAMENRHIMYNETLEYIKELERENKILVIRPESSLNIPHITKDPNELERVYQLGRRAGYKYLNQLKKWSS